jgi:hypothetical protein
MADARFEEAVAEERERSAEERSTEEQEHERCADGERAMAIVEIGSTFKYQGQEVVVRTKDVRSEHSFMCKVPGRRAHKPFNALSTMKALLFVRVIQGPVSLTIGGQNAIKSCRWSSSF